MSEENQRQDPKNQDPNIPTTDLLRKLAIGAKVVALGGGIATVAATAGDPHAIGWLVIGGAAIAYSGSLLVGWGALRNYGNLYELVHELRAQQQRQYLDLVSRHAETRDTLRDAVDNEMDQHRRHGSG